MSNWPLRAPGRRFSASQSGQRRCRPLTARRCVHATTVECVRARARRRLQHASMPAGRVCTWACACALALLLPLIVAADRPFVPSEDVFEHLHPSLLVAQYPLDEHLLDAAGPVAAAAGVPSASPFDAEAATHTGSVVYEGGVGGSGLAAYFDGVARVDTPHNLNPSVQPTVTVGAWVKPTHVNWASSRLAYDRERCFLAHGTGKQHRAVCIRGLYNSVASAWSVHTCSHASDGLGADLGATDPTASCADSVAQATPSDSFLVSLNRWTFVAAAWDATTGTRAVRLRGVLHLQGILTVVRLVVCRRGNAAC